MLRRYAVQRIAHHRFSNENRIYPALRLGPVRLFEGRKNFFARVKPFALIFRLCFFFVFVAAAAAAFF